MAHESFENPAIAAVMNELFVNIKVDREERPGIDHVYMSALHTLGEQGGWPLTMFLDSEGAPFWGGTYFNLALWPAGLHRRGPADLWNLSQRSRAHRAQCHCDRRGAAAEPAANDGGGLDHLAGQIARRFDCDHGGLGGAPKFPNPGLIELLWRHGAAATRRHARLRTGH